MTSGATILILCSSLLYNCLQYCAARDNITSTDYLTSNTSKIIESAGKKFQLGFFTPPGANNNTKYIGIWYSMDPKTIVWVANRDKPLNDSGVFAIDNKDGDLKLLDGANNHLYFSTNLQSSGGSRTAKLLDNGNLVLIDDQKGETLWQSFDHPTDTFLPGMKMDENLKLTSWKNRDDPAKGDFTFQQDQENDGGYIIHKGISSNIYWRSGDDSVRSFNPNKIEQFSPLGLLLSNNSRKPQKGSSNNSGKPQNLDNTMLLIDSTGKIQYLWWNIADTNGWDLKWSEPQGPCSVYNACGDFGSCDSSSDSSSETDKLKCTCFPGFEPSSPDDWNSNDFSGGCNSKTDFCASIKQDNDTKSKFLSVNVMKVGQNTQSVQAKDESDCRAKCLRNCTCRAYYYENGTYSRRGSGDYTDRCCIWTVDLTDIQDGHADGDDTYTLFIRVADPDTVISGFPEQPGGSRDKKKKNLVFICIVVIVAIALFCSISYIAYRRMIAKRRASIQGNPVFHLYVNERRVEGLTDQAQFREDDKKDIDVPFFELNHILAATDNFSQANKLGQGGFGPVYKGKFPNGEEIAVKRLSSNSGQGLQEFKNEVVLIAKLQHRNLVRLLGYCIEGNEKILLYEYMPNRSLDAFIFDQKLSFLLDWMKRFDIILGVARGLLYLHQDSRLRIVHRDMKASNILLDEEMNPKISDFGLARIVRGRETEANTNRVVGTFGYMSPEYALEGQFSVKSDVFSFGVIILEIISGKRNAGFHQSQLGWNLLGYAWSLWKEEKALDLLDHTLAESCNVNEVLKCINVGLLCVQEDPGDRPTMSKVLFLLGSQAETLPNPKQPAFISRKRLSGTTSSPSTKPETESRNEITFSMEEGR